MKRILEILFLAWLGIVIGMCWTALRVASTCAVPGSALSIAGEHYICAPAGAVQREDSSTAPASDKPAPRMVV
ncbi:hypothetical protein [Burkholderia anthina]|uniref:hypothetical protein n=1 Tax=Burkholderia anthina TaxID=179879 RepID=UPI00158E08FA|nr:hypothetical protein [Burkholderia anthina]